MCFIKPQNLFNMHAFIALDKSVAMVAPPTFCFQLLRVCLHDIVYMFILAMYTMYIVIREALCIIQE